MSTLKVDYLVGRELEIPQIESLGDVESFVTTAGQTDFVLTRIDSTSKIRVYVDGDLATYEWVNLNTVRPISPAPTTGLVVRVFKVPGELAYKDYQNIADLVSDEALINAIIFS